MTGQTFLIIFLIWQTAVTIVFHYCVYWLWKRKLFQLTLSYWIGVISFFMVILPGYCYVGIPEFRWWVEEETSTPFLSYWCLILGLCAPGWLAILLDKFFATLVPIWEKAGYTTHKRYRILKNLEAGRSGRRKRLCFLFYLIASLFPMMHFFRFVYNPFR